MTVWHSSIVTAWLMVVHVGMSSAEGSQSPLVAAIDWHERDKDVYPIEQSHLSLLKDTGKYSD